LEFWSLHRRSLAAAHRNSRVIWLVVPVSG
jgi:hypothetical protein